MSEVQLTKGGRQSRHKYTLLRKQATLAAACDGQKLTPWQIKVALWYLDQVTSPKPDQVRSYAQKITGNQPISQRAINNLLRNPAWLAFLMQMEEEAVAKARVIAESRAEEAVTTHFEAIQELKAAEKWADIAKFTNPILDRVWNPKNGVTQSAQIIQIVVGQTGSFAAANAKLANAIEIVTTEEVKGG
jgi:hypothetical protein